MAYDSPPHYEAKLNTYQAWERILRECATVYDDIFRPVSVTALYRVIRPGGRETPPPELEKYPEHLWRDVAGHYFMRGEEKITVTPPVSELLLASAR